MKKINLKSLLVLSVLASIILSSCSHSDKEVFRLVPYSSSFVGTVNPGQIIMKSGAKDIEYIRDLVASRPVFRQLLEDPSFSGLKADAYSAVFLMGKDVKYLGVVLPVRDKNDFEKFLDILGKEYNTQFEKHKGNGFTYSMEGSNILAWNSKVVLHLTCLSGTDSVPVETKAAELFTLSDENSVLSDKDLSSFLGNQKDINVWMSSNQLSAITGQEAGLLGELGGLSNNYAHISLDFQDGAMVLSSNLFLNPDLKKNIAKYNFLDRNAGKELLKVLPGDNLILAANLCVDPEKILNIFKSLQNAGSENEGKLEKETGKSKEELLATFSGRLAFAVNGRITASENASGPAMPVVSAAVQLNSDSIFRELVMHIRGSKPVESKDGYYIIKTEKYGVFAGVKNNVLLLTNSEPGMTEFISGGEVSNSILPLDISSSLTSDPLCLYMNLDLDSYSGEMNTYLKNKMDSRLATGIEGLGHSLKSLTLNGGLERTVLRLDMKDKTRNSLYIFLKAGEI